MGSVPYVYNTGSFHSFADSLSFSMGNSVVVNSKCKGLDHDTCFDTEGCYWYESFMSDFETCKSERVKTNLGRPFGRQNDQMAKIASMLSSLDVEEALRALDGNRWDQE